MTQNASQMLDSFLYLSRKDLERDNGHFLVLVIKRSGILSVKMVHKENGTIQLKGCCWNSQKAVVQFPCYKSIVLIEVNSRKSWSKIVNTLLCRFAYELNFSHNYFCKSAQSLRKQSQKCVKNSRPFTNRTDPLSESNRVPLSCQCSQRSSIATIWRTNWKVFQKTDWVKSVSMEVPECCEIGQYFMTKDTA